jgi:hypothetical protein
VVPSDSSLPAERRDVIAALVRHGLSALAAASLWRMAPGLVRDTRRRNREYSAMVDAESGVKVGPTLSGQAHQIDIRPQIAARRVEREYGHIHTHPSNGAFSDADVRVLLSNRELRVIVAVGDDARWHIMSHSETEDSVDPWTASDRFMLEFRRLLDDETISITDIPHAVWSAIASTLGLRYDRIEGMKR